MASESNDEKERAHELIDQLAPAQVAVVVPLLQFMLLDPVARSLAAAGVERQAISAEEAAAIDRARASLDGGQDISTRMSSASSACR